MELAANEERRMLELDEAIEAIDAAIEFKNEVMCSQVEEIRLEASLFESPSVSTLTYFTCYAARGASDATLEFNPPRNSLAFV